MARHLELRPGRRRHPRRHQRRGAGRPARRRVRRRPRAPGDVTAALARYDDQVGSHRIAVVGAGTAGAAAAILLARAGHAVALFERVAVPGPVGAGITLQPTGQAVLARLGLLDAIAARATRVDGLVCRRPDGRAVVDLRYADVDPGLFGYGLHRGVLFEALLAAARAEPRIALHCGVAIVSTELEAGARWLVDDGGARRGPFDAVVAADGSVSELHASGGVPVRARPYPWGALWFVAVDRGNTLTADRRVVQVVDGPRRMFGLLPTGRAPRGDDLVVSVFWSIRADRVAAFRARGLAAWRAEALALDPRTAPILDQITDLAELAFTQYRDVRMPRWHGERIVFIGDAAHATSPQLGQGANLALWDAMCLADAFADRGDVAAALAAYTAARRRHLNYYQLATRALTPLFQGDSRVLGWLRDAIFPASRWLAPVRRRMVRTMAGLDRGIVRRAIGLDELRRLALPPAAAAASG
ncbi:MAG: FAD-dependent monooxygenase [Deltaproteobacteria bacterium]|nr:MAG: FAD-dependent monooxygenase [Deltaproteobacteria bacterium]